MRMRIIHAAGILAISFLSSVVPSPASSQDAADQLVRLRGKEYRERVVQLAATPDVQTTLEGRSATEHMRLLAKIVEQRKSHVGVFDEYSKYILSLRQRLQSPQFPIGTRPGYIAGSLMVFSARGVERKEVEESVGWKETPSGMIQQTQTVNKYTEEDVRNGRARNKAARMAILEHFLKFAEEGGEYEQRELVEVVHELWGGKNEDDGVPVESLLEELSQDETRAPSVRVAAMSRVPAGKRKGARELMLKVLQNQETGSDTDDNYHVYQAIDYFKQHDLAALKKIRTETPWKQALINEAAGLPVPPLPKATQREVHVDINSLNGVIQ